MESHRLRMKIGPHEFEAEGTVEEVNRQFNLWKELIAGPQTAPNVAQPVPAVAAPTTTTDTLPASGQPDTAPFFPEIFSADARKGIVSLRIHPPGDSRDADAGLLLVYAFRRLLNVEQVLAGRLKDALELSGIRVDRIDRTIGAYHQAGLLMKSGFGKGGKYSLSLTGMQRAEHLAHELAAQLA